MMQMGKENKSDHGAPEVLRDKALQAVRLQQQVQVGFVGALEHRSWKNVSLQIQAILI